jgi:hypothetical protein
MHQEGVIMRLKPRRVAVGILAWLLAAGLGADTALAEPLPWDQERAADLAKKLATEVSKIKLEVPHTEGDPDIKTVVHQDLGTLQHRSIALASHLSGGQNREQTAPLFNHMQALVVALQKDAQTLPEIREDAGREIDAARATLDELARYYE